MARAQGARAQMALAFETNYGTPPASGFTKMPFASTTLERKVMPNTKRNKQEC
jgi:hypothetical protein